MQSPANRNLRLFTLLYIDESQTQRSSIGRGVLSSKDVYVRCASTLLSTCRSHGFNLEILTNDPGYINKELRRLGAPEIAVGASFPRDVPRGIPFYAAHFKLDAIQQLGSGAFGDRIGLIDNDVIMLRAPSIDLAQWTEDRLFVYDISDSVTEEYGRKLIRSDLTRVAETELNSIRWFGGEFVAGSSSAFRTLSDRLERLWPTYRRIATELHHTGDEMIVSAAINLLVGEGKLVVTDVGDEHHRWISRWFSTRARFSQRPLSHHLDSCILHLPADKRFIADYAAQSFEPSSFVASYKRHVRRKLLVRKLVNLANLFKGERLRHVPSLS